MSSFTSSSEPVRLFLRALIGALVVAMLLALGYRYGRHASRIDYHGAVAAKQARLKALSSPKVIVIGGSNAAFGLDSERLEEALCMPVVNMAIHAGLGVEYMVNEVKGSIGKGDIVIASFEFALYSKAILDSEVHVLTADLVPGAFAAMPWYRRPRVYLDIAAMRLQASWKYATGEWDEEVAEKVYRASGFNERGDLVSHLGLPPRGPDRQQAVKHLRPFFGNDMLPLVRELSDSVQAHQATLFVTWPAMALSSQRRDVVDVVRDRMSSEGFPLLGDQADYLYPDSAFLDSHYHLRASGRQQRTQQLIHDLCASGRVRCCSGQ